jgi:fimbrial isopeptide formation D2 family protein
MNKIQKITIGGIFLLTMCFLTYAGTNHGFDVSRVLATSVSSSSSSSSASASAGGASASAGGASASTAGSTGSSGSSSSSSSSSSASASAVRVYSALAVSCVANASSVSANQSVTFSPVVSGGNGLYSYLWSGACTGSGASCSNSFTSPGTHTAGITVISGSSSASASCSVSVNQANIICWTNTDCGSNGNVGGPYCQGNNVYQNYKTYTCNNAGTSFSSCTNTIIPQLQATCLTNQICGNGSCTNTCTANYQQRCVGTSMYWFDSCGVQGNYVGACGNTCTANYQQRCVGTSMYWFDSCGVQGNYVGACGNTCTANYQQRCVGTSMYWFDSCGVQGNYVGACGQANSTITLSKTVKNLTSGSGFSSSTTANPLDMVMFMITLQANGSDAQNVYVRDILPTNLIYNNQLVVACTGTTNGSNNCNNSNYNYSGSVTSGINLNTIYAGQTVTITYQAQVAPSQNFTYGITTLNNSASATSSQAGNTPNAIASVIVSKAGVLGASTVISTGLTNNFWVDSFFLPLLLILIGFWMWKTGIFFGIKKWIRG